MSLICLTKSMVYFFVGSCKKVLINHVLVHRRSMMSFLDILIFLNYGLPHRRQL